MFTGEFREVNQQEIELPTMDTNIMESIIKFMYTGKVQVTTGSLEKITKAANFFGIDALLEKCVETIKQRINIQNSIELLEFAEHISNNNLSNYAKDFFIANFKTIALENSDIKCMSHSLLIARIEDEATSIHEDPTENEEQLFQLGSENLQSKSEDVQETFLPRLMKAVHLPLVSEGFLQDLARKVENQPAGKALIEEARKVKSNLSNYEATERPPRSNPSLR